MNALAITMPSQKKLNTYGVESPCEYSPGVGSFLANPGLSKAKLVPSCIVTTFIMEYTFIGIITQYLRHYMAATFTITNTSIANP